MREARDIALGRRVRVLVVCEQSMPVAFAQLERAGAAAEITQVYVRPAHRRVGLGAALARAAIEAAGDVGDLWISTDDAGRPKHLLRAPRLSTSMDGDGVPPATLSEWQGPFQ